MLPSPPKTSTLQLVAGASVISFSPVFVRLMEMGPTSIGFYRMALAGLILLSLALGLRQRLWKNRTSLGLTFLASVFFALDLICWHRSIPLIGPGLSTLLANFQVFFLTAFGVLILREKLTWRFLCAIPTALLGLWLIVGWNWGQLSDSYRQGVIFGLLTAISYGAYILTLRYSQAHHASLDPIANMASIGVFTALLLGLLSLCQQESLGIPDWRNGGLVLSYALVAQVIGWVILSKALPHVAASRAGLILLLQPTLALAWDVLFFARPVQGREMVGALLALGAIYLGSGASQEESSAIS